MSRRCAGGPRPSQSWSPCAGPGGECWPDHHVVPRVRVLGLRLFCSVDDGSGFTFLEQVISLWAQEGVLCKEVFQVWA